MPERLVMFFRLIYCIKRYTENGASEIVENDDLSVGRSFSAANALIADDSPLPCRDRFSPGINAVRGMPFSPFCSLLDSQECWTFALPD
jgi:hypothetical protein